MTPRQRQLRRIRKLRGQHPSRVKGILAISGSSLISAFVLAMVIMIATTLGAYAYVARDLPSPDSLATREIARTTKILDREGNLLYEVFDPQAGRRTTVPLREISPYLVQATIATEDAQFYEHQGINFQGILRALWHDLNHQEDLQGGSSITQQLARNTLLPEEERMQVSVVRKLKEMILSLELSRRYSKEQILEYYLNEINYGNLSYGIEAAAQSYFGKSARDLDLAEASMLAGIPQAPAAQSPITNPDAARARQREVLDLMVRQGVITEAEAEAARAEKLVYQPASFEIRAPHFVMYVRQLLEEKYGARALYHDGLKVTTTLDPHLQELGESIVKEQVARTSRTINAHDASIVAMNPHTGEILTMVGSADYFDSSIDGQVNIATSERQPGSSFKPITYLTAFLKGWAPGTPFLDEPIRLQTGIGSQTYLVQNVDKRYHGIVSARDALAQSMNVPAIKAIQYAGVDEVIDQAHRMGITTLTRKGWYGPALTLGAGEVKPLDMAVVYSVFANEGVMAGVPVPDAAQQPGMRTVDPVAILKVEDANGKVLEEYKDPTERQVVDPAYAYLITSILSDPQARFPLYGNSLNLAGGRPAAVKTGTTENLQDFWTIGYTPDLVTVVWMGNADNAPLTSGLSGTTTGPIFSQFMNAALEGTPISQFKRPPNIVTAVICTASGKLAGPSCPRRKEEVFVAGKAPTQVDDSYITVRIDKTTGERATDATPPENVVNQTFTRGQEPPLPTPTPTAVKPAGTATPGAAATVRPGSPAVPSGSSSPTPVRTPTPVPAIPTPIVGAPTGVAPTPMPPVGSNGNPGGNRAN